MLGGFIMPLEINSIIKIETKKANKIFIYYFGLLGILFSIYSIIIKNSYVDKSLQNIMDMSLCGNVILGVLFLLPMIILINKFDRQLIFRNVLLVIFSIYILSMNYVLISFINPLRFCS